MNSLQTKIQVEFSSCRCNKITPNKEKCSLRQLIDYTVCLMVRTRHNNKRFPLKNNTTLPCFLLCRFTHTDVILCENIYKICLRH
ncbi:hypothetical protein FKM82_017588 [Ascaphus truei]